MCSTPPRRCGRWGRGWRESRRGRGGGEGVGGVGQTAGGRGRVGGAGVAGFAAPAKPLDFGNSATGCRLVMGAVAGCPITATFDGDASLRSRPTRPAREPVRLSG